MKVFAIALNTFREAIRNKILYSVVLFAAIVVGISAFFGSVSIGSQEKVIKDFGLFSLSFFGALLAILSGVSLLNKELKQKTIYNIMSKPVQRWQFILGKHLGLMMTVHVLVALMSIALVGFLGLLEGRIDWLLFQAVGFVLLEVCIISAVTMFFSSLVVTTTLTGLFTLGTYLAGRSIGSLSYFMDGRGGYHPALSGLVKVLNCILPDLSLFNINDAVVYGNQVSLAHFGYAAVYSLSYSTIALLLAALIFSRRELN